MGVKLTPTQKTTTLKKTSLIRVNKHETVTDNPSIRIFINKMENRITFTIKTGYYLELLKPETVKLLGSTKNKTLSMKIVKIYLI